MKDGWEKVTIGQIGRIITGKTPPTAHQEYYDGPYPFITPTDMGYDGRNIETERTVSEEGFEYQKQLILPPKTTCFVCIGATIGKICLTKTDSFTNQQINSIIVEKDLYDNDFVYYLLRTQESKVKSIAGGAATPIVCKSSFSSVEVVVPKLPQQISIASILSAYDDLIENNTRRIKILEEMARVIYREWFVEFKAPGINLRKATLEEKKVTGKDVIPEGWEVKSIGDILENIQSGSRPKGGIDPNQRGIPSIGAENVIGLGQYDYSKDKFVSKEFFDKMTRGKIKSGDVLLYKDGAQIGRKSLFRDGFPYELCCINEHVFILRSKAPMTQNFLFFGLDRDDMTKKIQNLNVNAAQPGINQVGVQGLLIVFPNIEMIKQFEEIVEPQMKLLFQLAKKNQNLRQTRDLLLPKLISGEVEV
jgi:type I restriction enzyme S subunit